MEAIKFNLQLFADAGTLVNATGGYVNAYNGNVENFEGKNDLSPLLKDYYDTKLLENTRIELYYAQFAARQPLPAGHGGSVEWRKFITFERAGELQEGVIPTGQKMGQTKIRGGIKQYGTYVSISDRLELRAYDDTIAAASQEMGASAAETQEALIRDALLLGTNVMYCDNIDKSTGAAKNTPTAANEMGASNTNGWALLTPAMINKAVTIMKKDRVPRINGRYYAVVHPSVAHDLRECEGWIEAHKYAAPEQLFNGEIGELHGVRFIENVFAPVLGGEYYENKDGGVSYASYFFGKDAFGIIDPEGGGLQMMIKDKGTIGGPLEQYSTVGYKFETNGATILYEERMLRVMSTTSFSAVDAEN